MVPRNSTEGRRCNRPRTGDMRTGVRQNRGSCRQVACRMPPRSPQRQKLLEPEHSHPEPKNDSESILARHSPYPDPARYPISLSAVSGGFSQPPAQDSPPASRNSVPFAPGSPLPGDDFGVFRASGEASRGSAPPIRASPATARVSASAKVYIRGLIGSWPPDARTPRGPTSPRGARIYIAP